MEEELYGMADLSHYINGRPLFPAISTPLPRFLPYIHRSSSSVSDHNQPRSHHDMLLTFNRSDSITSTTIAPPAGVATIDFSSGCAGGGGLRGFEMDGGGSGGGRWPRQETLTLLEIRSRLDVKFKEANQKGPLWDEVSRKWEQCNLQLKLRILSCVTVIYVHLFQNSMRIMSDEYGYQRSGKKCREKFENLYKYYKKTKESKAGRQDGKHYRFFRQLEALYGDQTTGNNSASISEKIHFSGANLLANNNQESYGASLISISNSSDFDTISSDYDSGLNQMLDGNVMSVMRKRGKRSLKAKIKDSIDAQMRQMMDKQEAWMEKMMKTIDENEQERFLREEQWRKQDAARIEREQQIWANEKALIEARDAALMDAFRKLSKKESSATCDVWTECEITRLIQLRNGMELKFQQSGISEEFLWEGIANKMACYDHRRSGLMCKEKWDCLINDYLIKCNKKRKELVSYGDRTIEQGIIEHTTTSDATNDSCFRYFSGDAYGRIVN